MLTKATDPWPETSTVVEVHPPAGLKKRRSRKEERREHTGCVHCQVDNTDFQINMIFFICEALSERTGANRVWWMEKQFLKLDVLFPLPCSLDLRNGNRQMRELREHAVHLEACQLFPVRSNPTCLPPSGICHTVGWERSEKGFFCALPRLFANQPLPRLLPSTLLCISLLSSLDHFQGVLLVAGAVSFPLPDLCHGT